MVHVMIYSFTLEYVVVMCCTTSDMCAPESMKYRAPLRAAALGVSVE